jgi:hypothetical protein
MNWSPVEKAAKDDAGNFQVLVGGAWRPASKVAKNNAGQFVAIFGDAPAAPAAPTTPPGQIPTGGDAAPAAAAPPPSMGQRAMTIVRPTVEALGGAGGAVLGAPLGPLGAVGGAGLGYGLAKGALDAVETFAGARAAPANAQTAVVEGARDVLQGATMETAGRVVAPFIGRVASGIAGRVQDLPRFGERRAAGIMQQVAGPDAVQIRNALMAPGNAGMTTAQSTANINSPAWQALAAEAASRNPRLALETAARQADESANALARVAGGSNAAAVRTTAEGARKSLSSRTSPMRDSALDRANLGKAVADMEARAIELGGAAADKVREVRSLMSAGDTAAAWARLDLIKRDLPVGATKYTHFGELSAKAMGEWSDAAVKGSLDLGAGARSAKQAAEALRANGVAPLKVDTVVDKIRSYLSNPKYAGNDEMEAVVKRLSSDMKQWVDKGGVIDAHALDALRKNSANAAIRDLLKGQAPDVQEKAAAAVMQKIKPLITDAIEAAGGKGYAEYLKTHAEGMRKISEQRLTGEALRMWETDKPGFVRLVNNKSPEVVEKILGPGNYDIAKNLAADRLGVLKSEAGKITRNMSAKEQADAGREALRLILQQNKSTLKLPNMLNPKITITNKALQALEKMLDAGTTDTLIAAMNSPKKAADLLAALPAEQRSKILSVMRNPESWGATGQAGRSGVNALLLSEDPNL